MKLKNILLVVSDIERSKAFYKDIFGLSVIRDFGENVILTEGVEPAAADGFENRLLCDCGIDRRHIILCVALLPRSGGLALFCHRQFGDGDPDAGDVFQIEITGEINLNRRGKRSIL